MAEAIRARAFFALLLVIAAADVNTACRRAHRAQDGPLQAWVHAGQEGERQAIRRIAEQYGADRIELVFIPEGAYDAQVQAAALAGDLPDILELDGPMLYGYVWSGHVVPLPISTENLIPSIVAQGTYRGRFYSAGLFDSGLALYGRRSRLEKAGARIPTDPAEAWTIGELDEILSKLAEDDPDGAVLDLQLEYRGEWYTYAFSPPIQSAGADLIDRRADPPHARGVLDSDAAVRALTHIQRWIERGYVDPNVDDLAFIDGRVALSWTGHWMYRRFAERFGQDVILLPLPSFKTGGDTAQIRAGTRTGQGSWNWAITSSCRDVRAAARFIEFLLEDDQVLALVEANAAVPGTKSAIAKSPLHRPGGPLHLFARQLAGGFSVPRPETPAYPVVSSIFQQAFDDIRSGVDVRTVLENAAAAIDRDIDDNRGYPESWPAGDRDRKE